MPLASSLTTPPLKDEALTHARQQLVDRAETCGVKEEDGLYCVKVYRTEGGTRA